MSAQGMLDVKELEELSDSGEIDTVLCMFTDLQGRFQGKRVLPHFFLEEVLGEEGLHACLYLLAIDMEMEPLPGYEYASWETGYGDFKMIPDLTTLRLCPWLEKTAMVICDINDEDTNEPVEVAPRQILKRQIQRAADAGFVVKTGSELEFYLFKDSYQEAARAQVPGPAAQLHLHHGLPHAPDHQGRVDHPADPQRHGGRGHPGRVLEGRVRQGTARDQHHVHRRAVERRQPRALQARREGDLRAERRRGRTFMAKWTMDEAGSSCHLHSSVWDAKGAKSLMRDDDAPHHMSETYRHYLGGLMANAREMAVDVRAVRELLQAVPAGVVGADGDRVEPRQPHVRLPDRRRAHGLPRGVPHPRRRRQPLPRVRLDHRRPGMWGIANKVEPPEMFVGNAYEAKDVPRVPTSLHEAIEAFRGSTVAREAFGDFVFEHLLNTAVQEQIIFDNNCVTDWELARYFERG